MEKALSTWLIENGYKCREAFVNDCAVEVVHAGRIDIIAWQPLLELWKGVWKNEKY